MAKIKIEIDLENDAFAENPGAEAAKILSEIALHLANVGITPRRYLTAPIRDTNGNTCGKYTFTK